jgi:hypothetical protein
VELPEAAQKGARFRLGLLPEGAILTIVLLHFSHGFVLPFSSPGDGQDLIDR